MGRVGVYHFLTFLAPVRTTFLARQRCPGHSENPDVTPPYSVPGLYKPQPTHAVAGISLWIIPPEQEDRRKLPISKPPSCHPVSIPATESRARDSSCLRWHKKTKPRRQPRCCSPEIPATPGDTTITGKISGYPAAVQRRLRRPNHCAPALLYRVTRSGWFSPTSSAGIVAAVAVKLHPTYYQIDLTLK